MRALRDELGQIDVDGHHWLRHLHRRLDAVPGACLDDLPEPAVAAPSIARRGEVLSPAPGGD